MKRFKNILYHADGAASQGRSLDRVLALAQSNNAALTVMDVVPKSDLGKWDEQRFGLNLDPLFRQHRLEEPEALVEPRRESGVRIYTQIVSGTPFLELIRAIIGNTAENVHRTTRASVVAVKPDGFVSPVTVP